MSKKIISILLSAVLITAVPITAFAESAVQEPFTFSHEAEETSNSFAVGEYTLPSVYGTDTTEKNFAALNYRYQALAEQMEGFGEKKELDIPEFQSGYATDIQTLFQNVYGDIAKNAKLEEPQIPKSFDVSKMMQDAKNKRASVLGDFKSSDMYQSTLNTISIGYAFSEAAKIKTMPELLSASEMQNKLNAISGTAKDLVDANSSAVDLSVLLEQYKAATNAGNDSGAAVQNDATAKQAFDNYKAEISAYMDAERLEDIKKVDRAASDNPIYKYYDADELTNKIPPKGSEK